MDLNVLRTPAWHMALVPLLWLTALHYRARDPGIAWWWLAWAFFVSWLADSAAFTFGNAWMIGAVYPVSQSALIAAVFLNRTDARLALIVFSVVAIADVLVFGVGQTDAGGFTQPDIWFRVVAWGTVCGIVYDRPGLGRLRTTLLVYFGIGLLAWLAFAGRPDLWSLWIAYQGTRLVGLLLFCWAAAHPTPSLRLSTPRRVASWPH